MISDIRFDRYIYFVKVLLEAQIIAHGCSQRLLLDPHLVPVDYLQIMSGVEGVEQVPTVEHIEIATPEATTRAETKPAKDSPASDAPFEDDVADVAARMEEAAVAAGMAVEPPPGFEAASFQAAVDKAAAAATAVALAAAEAAAKKAKVEPDPMQKLLQMMMGTMGADLKALKSDLAASKAHNEKLSADVDELRKGEMDSIKEKGADGEGYKKNDDEVDEAGQPKLKRLDRTDVDKPDKYSGNADHWLK